ncbi:MAG: hypothetical protein WED10_09160 [Brumimicrobium sp.]
MKLTKNEIIIWSAGVCIIAFISPFFFSSKSDSILNLLSVAFTAVCAVAAILTLIFAVIIYDRVSLKGKFLENQTNKVFELVDELKGNRISIHSGNVIIFVRFTGTALKGLSGLKSFEYCRENKLLLNYDDYNSSTKKIFEVSRSYWLPEEIKSKVDFLNIYGFNESVNYKAFRGYSRVQIGQNKEIMHDYRWHTTIPEISVEEFITNIDKLVRSIEAWLKENSDIKLDLKLSEPEKYVEKQNN